MSGNFFEFKDSLFKFLNTGRKITVKNTSSIISTKIEQTNQNF